jgi:hypothetical protein
VVVAASEIESLRLRLFEEFDRIVRVVDGLDEDAMNWKPDAASANSLLVLATHTLGAAEEHILHQLCGNTIDRSRPAEFAAVGSGAHLRDRAEDVKRRIVAALRGIDTALLDEERDTPVGKRPMRSWLVHAVAHAADHAGQAELTRDLWLARSKRA